MLTWFQQHIIISRQWTIVTFTTCLQSLFPERSIKYRYNINMKLALETFLVSTFVSQWITTIIWRSCVNFLHWQKHIMKNNNRWKGYQVIVRSRNINNSPPNNFFFIYWCSLINMCDDVIRSFKKQNGSTTTILEATKNPKYPRHIGEHPKPPRIRRIFGNITRTTITFAIDNKTTPSSWPLPFLKHDTRR
jgi:hypothetical protein